MLLLLLLLLAVIIEAMPSFVTAAFNAAKPGYELPGFSLTAGAKPERSSDVRLALDDITCIKPCSVNPGTKQKTHRRLIR
jgi:hypothetical protein